MIRTRGRWFAKRFTAAYVCGLALGLFLPATCSAQMSAFPAGERLAASEAESKTSQQLLLDLASARQMLANHPSAQANLSLGRALKALGDTESASKAFDRALDLNLELAEAWFEKASIISDQGDWSKAADLFRRAVAASPGYALAHLGLGEVLLRTGEFDNSASEFEAALRIDGKSSAAHQGLGLIDLQEGKLERGFR